MNRFWNPYKEHHYQIEHIANNEIRVINELDSLPKVGWNFIAKWRNQPNVNRVAPAIHIQKSKNIHLEGVNIHSAAGMGIIGEKSENITLKNVKVTPTPNSNRIISTTADATHFVNCRGLVEITNCHFEASLDDGLNIHGNYATIREKLDDKTLLAEIVHVQQEGFIFAEKGDSIDLIDPSTLLPFSNPVVVEGFKIINDQFFEIKFVTAIPEIQEGYGLENLTWNADLILTGTTIKNNWARGALFKTGGKILIENNYVSSSMSGLRNWGEMNFFNESGRVRDVLITKNTFENVCRVGNGQVAIVIFPQIKKFNSDGDRKYYNSNIKIVDNIFNTFDKGILFAQSVNGLEFSRNRILINNDFSPLFPEKPTIEIRESRNIHITQNEYQDFSPGTILIDEFSNLSAEIKANKNLKR